MKKILSFTTIMLIMMACNSSKDKHISAEAAIDSSRVTSIILNVEGMTCTGCEQTICKAVGQLPGVTGVTASFTDSSATVSFDSVLSSLDEITTVIEEAGYKVMAEK
jgi:mercuric ion transport protein